MLNFKVQLNINEDFLELKGVKRAITINGLEMQSKAREFVNVDTGRLQSSIVFERSQNGKAARVGSGVEYAAPQQAINQYLTRALKEQLPLFERDIERAVLKGV